MAYKRGKFSTLEQDALHEALEHYKAQRNLNDDELRDVIFAKGKKARDENSTFWMELGASPLLHASLLKRTTSLTFLSLLLLMFFNRSSLDSYEGPGTTRHCLLPLRQEDLSSDGEAGSLDQGDGRQAASVRPPPLPSFSTSTKWNLNFYAVVWYGFGSVRSLCLVLSGRGWRMRSVEWRATAETGTGTTSSTRRVVERVRVSVLLSSKARSSGLTRSAAS